jgi:hypothetical protein
MRGTSRRPARRPMASGGSPLWPQSWSGALPDGATRMLLLSDSEDGKECVSKRSCSPSALIASPLSPCCRTAATTSATLAICQQQQPECLTGSTSGCASSNCCSHCAAFAVRTHTPSTVWRVMWSRPSGCCGMVARSVASRSSKRCGERRAGSERITHWGSSSATCAAAPPSSSTTHVDERSTFPSHRPAQSLPLTT